MDLKDMVAVEMSFEHWFTPANAVGLCIVQNAPGRREKAEEIAKQQESTECQEGQGNGRKKPPQQQNDLRCRSSMLKSLK